MINYKEKLHNIKAFVLDLDGVLTDGRIYSYFDYGQYKKMRQSSTKDGYAIQYATKKGYHIAVITGAKRDSFVDLYRSLGVKEIYCKAADKSEYYERFQKKHNLLDENILAIGDDIPDYPILKRAGVSVCPANAATEIKQMCDYVSPFGGGEGCVRDAIEQVMRLHKTWFNEDACVW